jgi:hypothetical protein
MQVNFSSLSNSSWSGKLARAPLALMPERAAVVPDELLAIPQEQAGART